MSSKFRAIMASRAMVLFTETGNKRENIVFVRKINLNEQNCFNSYMSWK